MRAATTAPPTLGEFGPRASLMMRLKLGLFGMAKLGGPTNSGDSLRLGRAIQCEITRRRPVQIVA
jgi:hypothetical protein